MTLLAERFERFRVAELRGFPMCRLLLLFVSFCLAGCVRPAVIDRDDEAAVSSGKLAVLIVEETEDRVKPENRKYLGVLNSVAVRTWLDEHCRKVDGKPGWLWTDDDAELDRLDTYWREAMNQPRKSLPWIVISNGRRGTSGPLPASEDELLSMLKKWSGK